VPTTNVFEATLGVQKLKWDATWNVVAWLLDPQQGHGLGPAVTSRLSQHLFGVAETTCCLRAEHNLGTHQGQSKWADLTICFPSSLAATRVAVFDDIDMRSPGAQRKLGNLRCYGELARVLHPHADVRVVALTNAAKAETVERIRTIASKHLGPEDGPPGNGCSWRLLPLVTLGTWVSEAVSEVAALKKTASCLPDFVDWTRALQPQ
jgi:hypothetical protein